MSAKKFLELLDRNGLLEDSVMSELRRQVAEGRGKVTAEAIAKALVDKGHLTKFQATKLVGEAVAAGEKESPERTPAPAAEDDLLGLAPLDEVSPPAPTESKSARRAEPAGRPKPPAAEVVEAADGLVPVEDAADGLTPIPAAPAPKPTPSNFGLEPLGGGLAGLDSSDPFAPEPTAAAARPAPKPKQTKWDTKLIMGGTGTLAVLLLVGGILYSWLSSEPIIKTWEAAEGAYNSGNYADAKDKYEKFLAAAGEDNEKSSKARVRIHLTVLRNDLSDPERGLKTAEELLPKIDAEADSSLARDEFPGLLPALPEGFIKRAQSASDTKAREEILVKAKQARDLVNRPGVITSANRVKIQPQLSRIDEDIALIERSIVQDKDLAATIVAIEGRAESGETVQGYQLYNDLLKKYPGLKNDAGLSAAVAKVTSRERTLVKIQQQQVAAESADAPRPSQFRVVLANRSEGDAKLAGQIAIFRLGTSAYALDAGTGKLLWTRFLGAASLANPVRISAQPDADVLLVDSRRWELLRLQAADGKLVWRLPIGESFAEPTAGGNRLFVSTESGRILEIDAESGASRRHVKIPQRLTVSPVVSADRPRMYQVGDHSNLYVLHTDSLQCEDVIYLGHVSGSVSIPPLVLMGHVFVTETPAADYSLVHSFRIASQGQGPKLFRPQAAVRTAGRVMVSPIPYGRRLLVVTDRAEMRVFDVDASKNENTLADAGRLPPTLTSPHVGYPLIDGPTIWLADDKLTKYTVQVTRKEVTRDPVMTNIGDTFVAAPQLVGSHLIHARRPAGSTGVQVACIHVDDPRKPIWQIQLGVPAGRIAVDPAKKEIVAVSSGGAWFPVSGAVLRAGLADRPAQEVAPAPGGTAFTAAVDLTGGSVVFCNPQTPRTLLMYDPSQADTRLKVVSLTSPEGPAACAPIAFQQAVLVASTAGEIGLYQPQDGAAKALPFQPKLEPDTKVHWRRPTTVGTNDREVVIADDRRNLFRLGIKDQPQPHLASLVAVQVDVDLVNGLAAVGETVYGVARTADKGDTVVAFAAADLKQVQEFDLGGERVTWGPERVGDAVLVVTEHRHLRVFEASRKERYARPAEIPGEPAGPPLVVGDQWVFGSVDGVVFSLTAATGQALGQVDLGEPLGAGPVAYQDRLLLCGSDGTLHVVAMPTASPPAKGT